MIQLGADVADPGLMELAKSKRQTKIISLIQTHLYKMVHGKHGKRKGQTKAVQKKTVGNLAEDVKEKSDPKEAMRRMILTKVDQDGELMPLTDEEWETFKSQHGELAEYFTDPSKIHSLELPPYSQHHPICDHWSVAALRILKAILLLKESSIFKTPVIPTDTFAPDYLEIIESPMDFKTIGTKLQSHLYHRAQDFEADVRLVFSNCLLYNGPLNSINLMANKVEQDFNRQLIQTAWSYYL